MFYDFIYNLIANFVEKYYWTQVYRNDAYHLSALEFVDMLNNSKEFWATTGATIATIALAAAIIVVGVKLEMYLIKQNSLEA
jgi:hypothetical protein